ncbi:MAG TPA: GNAT family N-acetyltransferase [Acidobacteriaceae bacterium]|nr:GNAT family N-acetyltransferase [Acidobacteriaceae bacterium]
MDSTDPQIVYTDEGRAEDRDRIAQCLSEYNLRHGPDPGFRMLGLLLRSKEGETVGGLWGRSAYDWLFIDFLVVPAPLRGTGLGTRLMRQAEAIARERGCIGVWLDTFSFQALPFYRKLGYSVFGELRDYPRGNSRTWLAKRL